MSGKKCRRPGCENPETWWGYCEYPHPVSHCNEMHKMEMVRDAALAEIHFLRRGIEAYQRMLWETTETPGGTERKMLYAEEMLAWEREDKQRDEKG